MISPQITRNPAGALARVRACADNLQLMRSAKPLRRGKRYPWDASSTRFWWWTSLLPYLTNARDTAPGELLPLDPAPAELLPLDPAEKKWT